MGFIMKSLNSTSKINMAYTSKFTLLACSMFLFIKRGMAFSHTSFKNEPSQPFTFSKPMSRSYQQSLSTFKFQGEKHSNRDDTIFSERFQAKLKSNQDMGRRSILSAVIAPVAGLSLTWAANPLESFAEPISSPIELDTALTSEIGLLESRITENLMSSPTYGLEGSDIFYPSYFAGVWNVSSVATEVYAPCGVALFGGNTTYQAAKKEIGIENALKYRSRFLADQSSAKSIAIADREFNVREIAKVAMGKNSVQDVSKATPNKFSCLLSPAGSGGKLFNVNMISVARRQENKSKSDFDCSEVIRQIISPYNSNGAGTSIPSANPGSTSILKEIETISSYQIGEINPSTGKVTEIKCVQRSASFLVPSQTDPMAYKMWQAARGRPVDVRFYEVTYTKI